MAEILIGLKDIRREPIKGWEDFFREGEDYLKAAKGAFLRHKESFTPEILFNIIAMAIEKFIMAALMRHGALPYNHTMTDLVEAMEEVFPDGVKSFRQGLLDLDKFQEICDVDAFRITPPALEEIPEMLELAHGLRNLAYSKIVGEAMP